MTTKTSDPPPERTKSFRAIKIIQYDYKNIRPAIGSRNNFGPSKNDYKNLQPTPEVYKIMQVHRNMTTKTFDPPSEPTKSFKVIAK